MGRKSPQRYPAPSNRQEIDAFVSRLAKTPMRRPSGNRGRLMFALDATASRQPTWDQACHIQAQMFTETAALGGLDVQLCYYRGFGDFNASPWYSESDPMLQRMLQTRCQGGLTQIARVLQHAARETRQRGVNALVFVGDSMEEDIDRLAHLAGELGLLGVPAFMFHEGGDALAGRAFKEIARLSGGAYCPFDAGSAQQLKDLLSAVAVFAAGGRAALVDFSARRGGVVKQLTHQIRPARRSG